MNTKFIDPSLQLSDASKRFMHLDSNDTARNAAKLRLDSNVAKLDSIVGPARSLHMARELEYHFQEVLKTQYAPLNGLAAFPKDSRVPEGVTSYTIKRVSHQGDARWHRNNNYDQPRSGVSAEEENRKVRHIISSISFDEFEAMSSRFAGSNLQGELREGAIRAIQEFLNDKIWTGDAAADVYGVVNYPFVPKTVSAVPISTGSTPEAILAELNRLSNLNDDASKTVFNPNTLMLPIRQYNHISQTILNTAGGPMTIKAAFLLNSDNIDEVRKIPELKGVGVGGTDVALFTRRQDQRAVSLVVPSEIKMLPIQKIDFENRIPVYMSYGGVMMRDPLNNLVVSTPAV